MAVTVDVMIENMEMTMIIKKTVNCNDFLNRSASGFFLKRQIGVRSNFGFYSQINRGAGGILF